MNALAPRWLPGPRTRAGLFRPRCLLALDEVILRLEAQAQGEAVEGAIFEALGWSVRAPRGREAWRVRSPLSLTWIPMPPVTRVTDGAAILVPPGWDHGSGHRRGHGFAWVRREDGGAWFECSSGPQPVLLARAALHGWRHILLESLT
jgi:hypothetical protein